MNQRYATQEPSGTSVIPARDEQKIAYEGETYYNLPLVKHSTYNWMIGMSYFSIGLAGASQALSAALEYSGVTGREPVVRTARYAALAGSLLTPVLYTVDLGVSRKWYNMLRIFRPTSLMSVGGAWLLTAFGFASGISAAGQALKDMGYQKAGRRIARLSSLPAALIGSFMATYTGAELEETSTPLWAETSPLLSSLFGLNNASNALALFELSGKASRVPDGIMRPVGYLAVVTEAAAIFELLRIEKRWTGAAHASGLYRSRRDLLYRTRLIALGKAAGLVLRAADLIRGGAGGRSLRTAACMASLAAGYALPSVILYAGNRSADSPRDYFEYTSPAPVGKSAVARVLSEERGARNVEGRQAEGGAPPGRRPVWKLLVIGGLSVAVAALVMKPKKAY